MPLHARLAWPRIASARRLVLYVARRRDGAPDASLCAEHFAVNSLPGYRIVRVARFAPECDLEAASALLRELVSDLREDGRVLRCRLRLVEPSTERRQRLAGDVVEAGFHPAPAESYEHTVLLDLSRSPEALLASFSRRVRQNLAEVEKHPLSVRPIDDVRHADRLTELMSESFRLTGEAAPEVRWRELLQLASAKPTMMRVSGLFRDGDADPRSLLAFAMAVRHGQCVEYLHGGATRDHGYKRLSLGYGLQWDIIRWAQDLGARQYDLGGVPLPDSPRSELLKGITSFKMAFGAPVVPAASEFELVVQPLKNKIAMAAARFSGMGNAVGYWP